MTDLPTATGILRAIEAGELTTAEAVAACLAVIDGKEEEIRAFAHVAADAARERAAEIDAAPGGGLLRGVPVAVKDVIDTADMPTEYGSPLYRGHRPARDAACVAVLRAEGAVVLGKAQTVEFASLGRTADTVNPHHHRHTPGGSSSGSGAAVAAGMVPVALGTQTGGSTIRPASFCGVAGMKPTFGTVPVEGMKAYAPSLDTVGWMARCVADLALVARAFRIDRDAGGAYTGLRGRIGFWRTPYWEAAGPDTRQALEETAAALRAAGIEVSEVSAPEGAERLNEAQDVIMHGEGRTAFLSEYLRWPRELHAEFVAEVENSRGIDGAALARAADYLGALRPRFDQAMEDYDAWLVPAVPGEAPAGLSSTGDAVFNRLWTGLHAPAVTLPGFTGSQGLPVGIQLVAGRYRDARLLATAARVEEVLAARR
ncbi:MAG: amidase [Gammaproteobacteria bacterium]|jgi:Asp-tRNA(Asn)/Glu-tRNA(Gln) amidotransferase A subunit family amidase|nr:amidase [Gammaproteobacteria bacterium]